MGNSDPNTTMLYTHVLKRGPMGVISPANLLMQPLHVNSGSENHCPLLTSLSESGYYN